MFTLGLRIGLDCGMVCAENYQRGGQRRLVPTDEGNEIMKAVRYFILTVMAVASLCLSPKGWAQASSTPGTNGGPPVSVAPPSALDLGGVPRGIRVMITAFDLTRDNFLAQQNL